MHIPSFAQGMLVAAALGGAGAYAARQSAVEQRPPSSPLQQGTQPTYFVEHPDHIQPGLALQGRFALLKNPFEGNAQRIAEGSKLFIAYNCMDCHGAEGSGAMGPSLQDSRMHFGGTAGNIYQSIYEGRPDGMPAWGGRIADDQIWRLVAYVQTLSKGHAVTTENFTGKTIARTGH
ncbi:MAG TPA: c-type cytochrome [Gemmatimonadaceae bacterium]|jgi:cytochrome c oxidase cbb3-type subunit 3|nr:c-type cytochrome [Gemmatimonadaceae bacterium]